MIINTNQVGTMANVRINDLSPVLNENVNLSMNLAVDDIAQTSKLSVLQLRDFFCNLFFPVVRSGGR